MYAILHCLVSYGNDRNANTRPQPKQPYSWILQHFYKRIQKVLSQNMNIETNTTKCTSSTTHNIMMIIVECWGIPPRVGTTQPLTTETSRARRRINPWPEHIKPCRQKLFSSQQTKNKALDTDLVQRYGTGNNVPVFYKGATTQDLMHKIPLNDGAWLDANVSD